MNARFNNVRFAVVLAAAVFVTGCAVGEGSGSIAAPFPQFTQHCDLSSGLAWDALKIDRPARAC